MSGAGVEGDQSTLASTSQSKSSDQVVDPRIDFLAGCLGGIAGLVVSAPLDIVKVRQQTSHGDHSNAWQTLVAIIREKPTAVLRGITAPLLGVAFMNGLIFSSYRLLMQLQEDSTETEPTLTQVTLAGAGSGIAASLATTPSELIKIRQQSYHGHTAPSTWTVVRGIIRKDGILGLYRGASVTALRDLAYGPYFLVYEATCRGFKRMKENSAISESSTTNTLDPTVVHHDSLIEEAEFEIQQLNWSELMFAGGLAGAAAWAATFPLDTIKSRIQNYAGPGRLSILKTARETYAERGLRGLLSGLGPTLIRAWPTNAAIFLTFELVMAAAR